MDIAEIKKTAEHKMGRSLETLKTELHKIRTGRAHPGILDQVHVEYYGSRVPIGQVANVTLLDARTISVQPWEKGMGPKIEKAIRESDLGLQPSNDGVVIRLSFPVLTEERRKEYVKLVKAKAEDARVSVRNIRRKGNDDLAALKKDGLAGDDEIARAEKELDALTKQHVDAIDEALKRKEAELLEV